MGPHFMLLLSIYVLYSNVTYIYPVSCLVEIKLFKLFQLFQIVSMRRGLFGKTFENLFELQAVQFLLVLCS